MYRRSRSGSTLPYSFHFMFLFLRALWQLVSVYFWDKSKSRALVPKSGQKAKADLEPKSGFAFSSLLGRFFGGFFLYVAGVTWLWHNVVHQRFVTRTKVKLWNATSRSSSDNTGIWQIYRQLAHRCGIANSWLKKQIAGKLDLIRQLKGIHLVLQSQQLFLTFSVKYAAQSNRMHAIM